MKRLLASDLDGTLIPLGKNPELLAAINDFSRLLSLQPTLQLAYVTGRHFELTRQGIQEYGLPEPDFIVCDVGTSIYIKDSDNKWVPDSRYSDYLSSRWKLSHAGELVDILKEVKGISLQEEYRQSALKLSYYAPLESDEILKDIARTLKASTITAKVIFSVDEILKRGLVDILPPETAKHTAVDYLCKNEPFDKTNVVYAGDSGNDLAVVHAGYKSILVGNTPEAVKLNAKEYTKDTPEKLYLAKAHSAAGVIEGCKNYLFFD